MTTLLLDFDGVIGSQQKYIGPHGEREFLAVSTRDSGAIRRLADSGVRVIIVTACKSKLIQDYADRHGVEVYATSDKAATLDNIGIDWGHAIAIGDDVSDREMMEKALMAYCPEDAHPEIRRYFPTLPAPGGGGVVAAYEYKKKHEYVVAETE